ncbi:MAG: type II secretion system protein N [Burkholderiaceae bacterium]
MNALLSFFALRGPAVLQALALLALAAGLGVAGAVFMAPEPRPLPPALQAQPARTPDVQALAQWFGGAPLRIAVTVQGVIASSDGHGSALLGINGAPAQAFRVGDTIAPGVVLANVSGQSVTLLQQGTRESIAVSSLAPLPANGFVTLPSADTPATQ